MPVNPCKQQHPIVDELLVRLNELQQEAHAERAAILEFDAGLNKAEADALAMLDLIRQNPLALAGITVLQIELDGGTDWLLTTDLAFARRHLRDILAKEVAVVNLVDVLDRQYGGIAVLTTFG